MLRDHSVWSSQVHNTPLQMQACSLFTLLIFCTTIFSCSVDIEREINSLTLSSDNIDKVAAICLGFKWPGFWILYPIWNPYHLQANLFARNLKSGQFWFQIPTVFKKTCFFVQKCQKVFLVLNCILIVRTLQFLQNFLLD